MSVAAARDSRPTIPSASLARVDVLTWLVFCAAVALMVSRHELGHDEAQAWNIARAATWPWDVITLGQVEGHTPFWHLVLWPLTRLGNPVAMQWLTAGLGMLFAALLLWDRPFARPVCLLVLFGYFPLYEYTVVARPYAITMVLCATLAIGLRRQSLTYPYAGLLCGLIAFTSAFGAAISLPLMALAMTEVRRGRTSSFVGLALYAGLLLLAVYFVVFPIGATAFEQKVLSGGRATVSHLAEAVLNAGFPHLDRLPLGIGAWTRDTLAGTWLTLLAGLVTVMALAIHLSGQRSRLWVWIACVVVFTLAVTYSGSRAERHLGHLYLAALTIAWVHAVWPRVSTGVTPVRSPTWAAAVLVLVLLYHVLAGVGAGTLDVLKAQSPWRNIAMHIEEHIARPYALFSDDGYGAGAVHAYLDVEPYDMSCPCPQRFTDWTRLAGTPLPGTIVPMLCEAVAADSTTLILATRPAWQPDDRFDVVKRFSAGYRQRETDEIRLFRLADPAAFLESCGTLHGGTG